MNPVIRFGEQLALPTWMLIISVSLSLSFIWLVKRTENRAAPIERNAALNLVIILMIAAVAGGRLMHVFYEAPAYYLADPWAILQIWQGGFVFYGALLAMAIALAWYSRWQMAIFLAWTDFLAPVLSLNYLLGRIGCFFNGCCYGKACALPWAIEFHAHADWGLPVISRHPTQLYAAVAEALALGLVLGFEKRQSVATPSSTRTVGQVFFLWLTLHSIGRLVMEYFRDDQRGPMLFSESISLWLSVVFLLLALWQLKCRFSFRQS